MLVTLKELYKILNFSKLKTKKTRAFLIVYIHIQLIFVFSVVFGC